MKWEGELYLELHNGTYTSVAEVKNYCRRMELRLRDLEVFASLAHLLTKAMGGEDGIEPFKYESEEIAEMWQTFLID
jgi:alpha-mannosidase